MKIEINGYYVMGLAIGGLLAIPISYLIVWLINCL